MLQTLEFLSKFTSDGDKLENIVFDNLWIKLASTLFTKLV